HQDLYGFIDIVSTPRGSGPLRLIQVFNESKSGGLRSRHLRKMLGDDTARSALYSLAANPGVRVEMWALKKSVREGHYFLVSVIGPRANIEERYRLTLDGERLKVRRGGRPR
ncbi:MAG: hypothetical protein DRJ60_06450, partial [Thermoprotei archaeon]